MVPYQSTYIVVVFGDSPKEFVSGMEGSRVYRGPSIPPYAVIPGQRVKGVGDPKPSPIFYRPPTQLHAGLHVEYSIHCAAALSES